MNGTGKFTFKDDHLVKRDAMDLAIKAIPFLDAEHKTDLTKQELCSLLRYMAADMVEFITDYQLRTIEHTRRDVEFDKWTAKDKIKSQKENNKENK